MFLFLFLFSLDSCDVQADGGKKKRLSVSVGASCYSDYDKLLFPVASVIGYYFTLEVPRVININFLQQFQYIKKRKGHENNVTK